MDTLGLLLNGIKNLAKVMGLIWIAGCINMQHRLVKMRKLNPMSYAESKQ